MQAVIYLIFNEGYLATHGDSLVRRADSLLQRVQHVLHARPILGPLAESGDIAAAIELEYPARLDVVTVGEPGLSNQSLIAAAREALRALLGPKPSPSPGQALPEESLDEMRHADELVERLKQEFSAEEVPPPATGES